MVIRLDYESGFTEKAFRELFTTHGIVLHFSGGQT